MNVSDVFIVDALRTPVGSSHRNLKSFTAVDLGAAVAKEILSRVTKGEDVGTLFMPDRE